MVKRKSRKRDLNKARIRVGKKPVWAGPESEEGVTQSLLSRYIPTPERFRIRVIDGLKEREGFRVPIEYGQMWHLCEEAFAANQDWEEVVDHYVDKLCRKYIYQQKEVIKWGTICKVEFPIYVEYWEHHEDVTSRTPLLQEESFFVPYTLPSGRVVNLRGKWDSVDIIGSVRKGYVYLQENKSKSDTDKQKIDRQLWYDLQTMLYLVALKVYLEDPDNFPTKHKSLKLKGVRYNVIKRPLSGGKGTIRPHQAKKNKPAETMEEFYSRLGDVIRENEEMFFGRWKVDVSDEDLDKFETHTLIPVLENLCDDYEWWSYCKSKGCDPFDGETRRKKFKYHCPRHYRLPYGIYSAVKQGGFDEVDDYLNTGSMSGLEKVTNLFPELEDE